MLQCRERRLLILPLRSLLRFYAGNNCRFFVGRSSKNRLADASADRRSGLS